MHSAVAYFVTALLTFASVALIGFWGAVHYQLLRTARRVPTARAGIGLARRSAGRPDAPHPSVCVVIPAHNESKVIASLYPHVFYGQNQLVFIDKGEKDGLKPGNRLQIVRKGDAWGDSLATPNAATRIALESPSPAAVEKVPTPRNRKALPDESVAELRVVFMRDHSAACVVTQSSREIEPGDVAQARKGY